MGRSPARPAARRSGSTCTAWIQSVVATPVCSPQRRSSSRASAGTSEGLAGSAVEHGDDRFEVLDAVAGEVGATREVRAQQSVGVLVPRALPRAADRRTRSPVRCPCAVGRVEPAFIPIMNIIGRTEGALLGSRAVTKSGGIRRLRGVLRRHRLSGRSPLLASRRPSRSPRCTGR